MPAAVQASCAPLVHQAHWCTTQPFLRCSYLSLTSQRSKQKLLMCNRYLAGCTTDFHPFLEHIQYKISSAFCTDTIFLLSDTCKFHQESSNFLVRIFGKKFRLFIDIFVLAMCIKCPLVPTELLKILAIKSDTWFVRYCGVSFHWIS